MSNQIQINQKLLEREDLLVEIHDLERRINGILGGEPYPLAAPATLPSRQKRKKPKRKPAAKKTPVIRLRKLDPETEQAYRVEYRDGEADHAEIHLDPRPIATLLNTPPPRVEILRVETVRRETDDAEWETVETLREPSLAQPETEA